MAEVVRTVEFWFSEAHLRQKCADWMFGKMVERWHEGVKWALLAVDALLRFPKLQKLRVTSVEGLTAHLESDNDTGHAIEARRTCVQTSSSTAFNPIDNP